eukprot:4845143-Pleurochrysis_carterae.AAC.1
MATSCEQWMQRHCAELTSTAAALDVQRRQRRCADVDRGGARREAAATALRTQRCCADNGVAQTSMAAAPD